MRGQGRQLRAKGTVKKNTTKKKTTKRSVKNDYFETTRIKTVDEDGALLGTRIVLNFYDDDLIYYLREMIEDHSLYNTRPKFDADRLLQYLVPLRDDANKIPGCAEVVALLEKEFAEEVEQIDTMLKEGVVSFNALTFLFRKGDKVYTYDGDYKIAGEVVSTRYKALFLSTAFEITISTIQSDGLSFRVVNQNFSIFPFDGTKKIKDLDVAPLTDKIQAELTERGKLYQRVALGASYLQYSGTLIWKEWWNTQIYKAAGRIMVDIPSFGRMCPHYRDNYYADSDDNGIKLTIIPEEKLYMTDPWIKGFSFACKKWGELAVEKMTEIKFDDNAFDTLVLDEDRKALIRALVENSDYAFSDIISGKGGGCIFLLHGPPGVGKTLTAESIAELLHRPLYSVSVGELGTDPDELEERLRQILEMASTWNAVILIDEADIFLERRTEHDIERNAMVGIFLRLLEYHQGVLFLTTNRVKSFDEAFHSRISVSLEYPELTAEDREKIWNNLLEAAEISHLDVKRLASHSINGRQIKNVIRLGQSLARSDNVEITEEHLEKTITITGQFQDRHINK